MELSEFVILLQQTCGEGKTNAVFMRSLFENISADQEIKFLSSDDEKFRKISAGTIPLPKTSAGELMAHIDRKRFEDFLDNLVSEDSLEILCEDFEPYLGISTSAEIIKKITNLFVEIIREASVKKRGKNIEKRQNNSKILIEDFDIIKDLTNIIRQLSSLPRDFLQSHLRYDPKEVRKKIKGNWRLLKEVCDDVELYYQEIEDIVRMISEEKPSFFNNLCEKIKFASEIYIEQNKTQEEVFYKVVEFIKSATLYENEISCRILASFFVQNCEVFDEVSE